MKLYLKFGLFFLGVVLLAFGFALGYGIFPAVVDTLVKDNLNLRDLDSEGRKNFESPPVPVYMKFFVYNVDNPDKVISGQEKPHLTEKGPYAYREIREKIDIVENECYIRAGQYKSYVFDESQSCEGCKAEDEVVVINAPLLGLVSVIRNKKTFHSFFSKINSVIQTGSSDETGSDFLEDFKDSLFITTSVNEFIFEGYKHGVIRWIIEAKGGMYWNLFQSSMPPVIQEENGFAVFNGKNDTAYNEYYEIDTAHCNSEDEADYSASDMKSYVKIRQWGISMEKLQPDLTSAYWWEKNGGYNGSNACNRLEGTDGQQFHPGVKDDEKLWIFSTDLCRSMFLTFQEEVDIEGIPALRYAPPYEALQVNTVDNVGFCMEVEKYVDWNACIKPTSDPYFLDLTECYKDPNYLGTCHDGTLNITRCMKNAPVIMSAPHFYQNPLELFNAVQGISKPNPNLHQTRLDIEPTTGMAIKLNKRIQINIPLVPEPAIEILQNVTQINLFPILWVDEGADIDQANIDKLKEMVVTPTKIVIAVQWVCVAVGVVMAVGVAIIHFFFRKKRGATTYIESE